MRNKLLFILVIFSSCRLSTEKASYDNSSIEISEIDTLSSFSSPSSTSKKGNFASNEDSTVQVYSGSDSRVRVDGDTTVIDNDFIFETLYGALVFQKIDSLYSDTDIKIIIKKK